MIMGKEIKLPFPTDMTVEGFNISVVSAAGFEIQYDCYDHDSVIHKISIIFSNVLAITYLQEATIKMEHLEGFNKLMEYRDSVWLKEIVGRWAKRHPRWATEDRINSYAHYRIYFDDLGAIDIIADGYEIKSED